MAVLHVKSPNGTQTNVDLNNVGNPIGSVQAFAGSTIPTGWLLCDGSAVSRTTYAALFAAIGTAYGAGDGSTTFNLPSLINIFIQGVDSKHSVGQFINAGIPNIQGWASCTSDALIYDGSGGALHAVQPITWDCIGKSGSMTPSLESPIGNDLYFNAGWYSSIYRDDYATVQPPAIMMNYIIKY